MSLTVGWRGSADVSLRRVPYSWSPHIITYRQMNPKQFQRLEKIASRRPIKFKGVNVSFDQFRHRPEIAPTNPTKMIPLAFDIDRFDRVQFNKLTHKVVQVSWKMPFRMLLAELGACCCRCFTWHPNFISGMAYVASSASSRWSSWILLLKCQTLLNGYKTWIGY